MEQNLPIVAKKVGNVVRAIIFVIKKNISKRKLLLDLNMMMKRGKINGKAFNRRSHHPTEHYEFNCNNSPVYPLSLFTTQKKHHNHKKTSQNTPAISDEHDQISVDPEVIKVLEMLNASPAVPGFGRSPMIRHLRVTDSPFPLSKGEDDSYVDEAAEKFIMKFYNGLRKEN